MNDSSKQLLAADSSRIQLELSHKMFSNSTFESLHRLSPLSSVLEKPTEMISRRLKGKRHPLSGMKVLMPELSENFGSDPEQFVEDLRSTHKLNARILETWINNTIADAASLNLPGQVIKKEAKLPLMRYNIDRTALLKAGLQSTEVDRLYRSLFVYSIGFYQLIQKTLEHTNKKYSIVTGIWKVYAVLLEYCCQLDYQMIITTLNSEKKEEIEQIEAEFQVQISRLENNEKELTENIVQAKLQVAEMQKELRNEITKREDIEDELMRRGSGHEEEVAMRLLFESKLNQLYAKLRDMQTNLDLMKEHLSELQKESTERAENLNIERKKNTELMRIKVETDHEMRKLDEKCKQVESVNQSLDRRLDESIKKIETLNTDNSNANSAISEKLNEIAQKNIMIEDLKFALEVSHAKADKLEASIIETDSERILHVARIKELEQTLADESSRNHFYQQEYVRIKELESLNASELGKYKEKFKETEEILMEIIKEKDSLAIKLDVKSTQADELKLNLADLQKKFEEMNKGRRLVEEHNESLSAKIEERNKEIKDNKIVFAKLKDEQDRYKTKEIEHETESTELRIKLQSVQKQFEATKETLEAKIKSLQEILESEKRIRESWIVRFEDEQRNHSNATKELILTHDKQNELQIKANNLETLYAESTKQNEKLNTSHKEDLEEILLLKFQNEDLLRKTRTLQILIENIDHDYKLREDEVRKEFEQANGSVNQMSENYRMKVEEVWVVALHNLEKYQESALEYKKLARIVAGLEENIAELKRQLERKGEYCEGFRIYAEELKHFIISQHAAGITLRSELKNLEIDLRKSRKELQDYKDLAPKDLRESSNPFEALQKQIEVLNNQIFEYQNVKIELKDKEMQWSEPLPELQDSEAQTDPITFELHKEPRSRSSIFSKGSRNDSKKDSNRDSRKDSERNSSYVNDGAQKLRPDSRLKGLYANHYGGSEEEKQIQSFLQHDEERITPLNLKSIYAKEALHDPNLSKSPNKLPILPKRSIQPSPTHAPSPIPTIPSNDFKRALKQAVSRRRNNLNE